MSAAALQNLNFIVSLTDRMSAPMGNILRTVDSVRANMRTGITDIGTGVAGLFSVGASVNKLTEKAIGFESAMADIRKVVDFPSPTGIKDFGNELLKMSHTIPITAQGLAQIAASGGQLGIASADLPDFTDIVAKMSTAFGLLPEEAGKNIAKLSNIFKMPIADMRLMGDALNHLDDNMATNAKDIIDVTSNIGGMAQMMGLTATQSAALATSMLSLGQAPDVAATGINALLLKLGTAGNQSKEFQSALGDVGLSVSKLESDLKTNGAQATITSFLEQIGKLDKDAQLKTLGKLFGAEYADNLATLVGGLDQYHKALGLVAKQESFMGSMEREFAIRSSTTENRLKILGNVWDHFLINAGTVFLPMVNDGIQLMNDLLDPVISTINTLANEYPTLTKYIGYATAGIFAFIAVISAASIAMGVLSLASGGFAIVMGILSSPIAAAVLAFLAVSAAIDYVVENWTTLKQSLMDGMGAFLEYIGVFGLVDTAIAKLNQLKAWWAGFDPLGDIAKGAISADPRIAGYINGMKSAWLDFKNWLSSINPFSGLDFNAGEIGGGLLSGIDTIKAGLTAFSSWITEINPFGGLNFGSGFTGDGFLSGIDAIKSGFGELATWLAGVDVFGSMGFGAASAVVAVLFGIESIKTGWMSAKLWLSTVNPFDALVTGAMSVVNWILSGIQTVQNGWLNAKLWLSTVNPFDALVTGAMSVVNWILSGIQTVQNGWLNAKLWLSGLNPFGGLLASAVSAVGSIIGTLERMKGWWSGFKGWLSGLNPFSGIANSLNGLMSKVSGLSHMKIGIPSLSIGGGSAPAAAGKGGLLSKISSTSNSSAKNTTVNVHNHGSAMSGARLANEMAMAGG